MDDHAGLIKQRLTDVHRLCTQLNLTEGAKRQARGLLIRCAFHQEKTPSCSVTLGPDGTIRVKCFSCGAGADALGLIAVVHKLDAHREFRQVLIIGAELAGLSDLASALQRGRSEDYVPPPAPERPAPTEPTPEYPDGAEVNALWTACTKVALDGEAVQYLKQRGIDPVAVSRLDLARVLAPTTALPRWARYRGEHETARTWMESGHRLILPVYDCDGRMRSVRAWRIVDGDTPKRLPPAGHRTAQLLLANASALTWLRHSEDMAFGPPTMQLIVCEGEPDYCARATLTDDEPVVGILSGSWHAGFANKIPSLSEIILRTDCDAAGDRYAQEIVASVSKIQVHIHRVTIETINAIEYAQRQ